MGWLKRLKLNSLSSPDIGTVFFFLNHHVYYVENEHRGARVDAWQLDRMLVAVVQVRDDIGLN